MEPLPDVLPPEPTFTLRGRDAGADEALRLYAQRAADRGASAEYVATVRAAAEAFQAYPVSITPGTWATALDGPPSGALPVPPAPVTHDHDRPMSKRV